MRVVKKLFIWIMVLFIAYISAFIFNCFVENNFVFEINLEYLIDKNTYLYTFFFFSTIAVIYAYNWNKSYWSRNSKNLMQGEESDKHILAGLEQAHFQTDKELTTNFTQIDYDKLPKIKMDGIPIKTKEDSKKLNITFAKNAHSLIIGTTGSGKTTSFINPSVQILSNTKSKPSMLISDPKGELYSLHAKALEKRGYDVKILDLRNPYCSIRWNPLEKTFIQYQEMLGLDSKVEINEELGYYIFEDVKYYNEEEMKAQIQVRKQELYDEIYEDLHDIVSVLCPILNKGEPIWESGAKNFILAITLAMLEDSENPKLNMTKEKFNFYNIMKIATNTQNDCEDLKEYFNGRSYQQNLKIQIKQSLINQGFYESINYSFFSPKDLDLIKAEENSSLRNAIKLINPLKETISIMRTSPAPSMIQAVVRNLKRQNKEGRLFEISKIFIPKSLPLKEYPIEENMLCLGVFGTDETFFTVKGAIETMAERFDLELEFEAGKQPFLHPGKTAKIKLNNEELGYMGLLSHEMQEELSVDNPVLIAELRYEKLVESAKTKVLYKNIVGTVVVKRDLAIIADGKLLNGQIEKVIKSACPSLTNVTLFDVYKGQQVEKGKMSLAYNLTMEIEDDEKVEEVANKNIYQILFALNKELNISIRQ